MLETGLRFCGSVLTPGEFKTRALWRFWDRVVLGSLCSWIGFCRRLWQIFNKLVKYVGSLWIYEIYVDLLVRGINRVGRYFRSKYILTDVIEKRNAVKRSININLVKM